MAYSKIISGILQGVNASDRKLVSLTDEFVIAHRNKQNRTIKEIVGHMIDSASNNTHRIIHLQYQKSPFEFPNYASNGNNDRWIAIQNYNDENWQTLVNLWRSSHLHIAHVIKNVDESKVENEWISASEYGNIKLKDMIVDFLRHFELHLGEINTVIDSANGK